MADLINTPFDVAEERRSFSTAMPPEEVGVVDNPYSDEELLDLWAVMKTECFDSRWVFERQWQRNIWYVLGRQWIEYQSKYGGWRDKRMAAWVPTPVTNKCKETVQAIRAMFTSINLSVNVRPNGSDPLNVATASTADQLVPLLHEAHFMNRAMTEFDFWLCVTGNAFLHCYVDYDIKHGSITITSEECMTCGAVYTSDKLTGAQPTCPDCGGTEFTPALDEEGNPIEKRNPKGVPTTLILSPLELSFPQTYTRFEDLPYVVRSRWRTKRYYESHPILKEMVSKISWQKSPQDHSLALFTSLTQANDLGMTSSYGGNSGHGSQHDEGITEHEVWMKPTDTYPDGLVFRVVGDSAPQIVHLEELESLPGPLPYRSADGVPLFTFAHATYDHVGGRILGSGPIDAIIQKQDQVNQLDSQVLLCLTRMGNPIWLWPKGCEIQKMTGMPGLVVKYTLDPMGPNAKPERVAGLPIDASVMQLREQYLRDIEELAGTFDIMKGAKPAGVEAFSAIQALIERSQARFSSVFQSRGDAYKQWASFSLELEREFGPNERTKAILTPARGWTFKTFQRAQLQGSFTLVVEDGSTTPKTNLGMRAAVEHANTLGMLNMADPDQQYEGLKLFGLTRMVPTLDIHVQAALQKQQAFEQWVQNDQAVQQLVMTAQTAQQDYQAQVEGAQQQAFLDPMAPVAPLAPPPSMLVDSPLEWLDWYNAQIHLQEFLKWANDDHIRELIADKSIVKQLLKLHLQEIQMALPPPPVAPGQQPPQAAGAARAMKNSNANSKPEQVPGKQSPQAG